MIIKAANVDEITNLSCVQINHVDISIKDDANIDQLVESDIWPEAVPSALIVSDETKAKFRSKTIVRAYVGNVNGKKILDFGCGNGYCVREALSAGAAISVGYDIKSHDAWSEPQPSDLSPAMSEPVLTTDFDEVLKYAPYDIVLVYDVIDHVEPNKIKDVISKILSACDFKTFVKVRCHPWTSIHGGHVYENLNKAYGHIFLSDEKLAEYQTEYVNKIGRPLATYKKYFEEFTVLNTTSHRSTANNNLKNIMNDKSIVKLLESKFDGNKEWQDNVLPIEFIDYLLSKK